MTKGIEIECVGGDIHIYMFMYMFMQTYIYICIHMSTKIYT